MSVEPIDLRSDTVTLPTPAMREAMYRAEVGDDVYGEDPTVRRIEELAAEMLGKEAGLYVISGTMGNLVSLLTHCQRGDELILGDNAHIYRYEQGSVSVLGGATFFIVPNLPNGMLDPADVENAIRPDDPHQPRTRGICLENTHNRCGGVALSPAQMATIKTVADRRGLIVHLDGARIFNAAIALGVEARDIAAQADSVQICLSKGLSAPVGSVICGRADFIREARRNRKIVGGGMRQAGMIAAAGIVALEQMVDRLAEDHANARALAEGLLDIGGYAIDMWTVQTNMVKVGFGDPAIQARDVSRLFLEHGVKINAMDAHHLRAVTHYGIERQQIDATLVAARKVMDALE
ncbi:MAG: low-specificity L-threonine aldolase [Anaerolineae bacterium]|nr:low-specificity L-threonine aldolase [Anaerolineae bacterium]